MKKVYCVMEGGDFPEGAPYGIFETIEEAVNFMNDCSTFVGWKGNTCIYCYTLGRHGYEEILDCLGEEIKK